MHAVPNNTFAAAVAGRQLRISPVFFPESEFPEWKELERKRLHSGADLARVLLAGERTGPIGTDGRASTASASMLTIRLPQTLCDEARCDLVRPHAHASERVGFLFGQLISPNGPVVLMTRYWPVPDHQYVRDSLVGARVHGDAFRTAMQSALDEGEGVFHTHLHDAPGCPQFSPVDRCELHRFIPAFQAVSCGQAAGLFLFSSDAASAAVWLSGKNLPERAARIVSVGFPLRFYGG